jgi:hypothetical protein
MKLTTLYVVVVGAILVWWLRSVKPNSLAQHFLIGALACPLCPNGSYLRSVVASARRQDLAREDSVA